MSEAPRRPTTATTPVAVAAVALAAAHHLDHVVRGHAGWPFEPELNAFTWSLVLYPAFAVELLLARRGAKAAMTLRTGLAAAGLVAVTAIHLGPVAVDRIDQIASAYTSIIAGVVAVAITIGLVVSLLVLVVLQVRANHAVGAPRPT